MQDVLQAISTIGFPIVMTLLVWWQNRELSQQLTSLIQSNTAAMANTTAAVQELQETIRALDGHV
jgi:hypothetical protein